MKSFIIIFTLVNFVSHYANALTDSTIKTTTIHCPNTFFISQINANLGAILDRANFRCNNHPFYSNFGDIGSPLAYITSPKSNTIRLPDSKKGWDRVNIGYGYYEPKGVDEVVVSIQVCQKDKCFETGFFYGLTICSANAAMSYACPRIASYTADNGKFFTGISATYNAQKKTGYVKSLIPLFE